MWEISPPFSRRDDKDKRFFSVTTKTFPLMPNVFLFALLVGCLFVAACASEPEPSAVNDEYDLFLLIGQSNMAGRGVVTAADSVPHPRVWTLTRDTMWVPALDPIHFDKPIAGVGPGRALGEAVAAQDPTVRVGLIPSAVGGSPIASWRPGAVDSATQAMPYDDALRRTRYAMQQGTLKAIVWHQGETDAMWRRAPQYEAALVELIAQLRQDLNASEVPFIIGQLGQFAESPWDDAWGAVDQAHQRVAQTVPNVFFVSSDGLGHKGDTLHFSADAMRTFGQRYAAAYLQATGNE